MLNPQQMNTILTRNTILETKGLSLLAKPMLLKFYLTANRFREIKVCLERILYIRLIIA
jgi:hypothetical protein